MADKDKKDETAGTGTNVPVVKWDDSAMGTSYANVCNVTSTREEVTLLFGTNQTLYAGQQEVTVKLGNRIILSPYAAKRLCKLLEHVVGQYEARFGELSLGHAVQTTEK
ncbi:DUF3467 domain-containing protein [Geomonas sp. Red69]|uniref:DUF3467 domain-containing protein n=1 Tax=Geomonas diazotrophica TaxID=2843197 RepID=A0ABX8JGT1_9BACT|nr:MULTISPECIES: DUF3467 domain-containing protein [Geomonas]MBU5635344.1 DUF3467 domain-containing protein [Geomonas diazotrophica]QWV97600.1 DUF3467 domain-containing protein [Geomonas nitrogeniifigens]QXE86741.1 DUF3467 domain-containing protein [Geomonas nitrogeniifigens]